MIYIRHCKSKKARLLYFLSGFGGIVDSLVIIFTLGYVTSSAYLYFSENAMRSEIKFRNY